MFIFEIEILSCPELSNAISITHYTLSTYDAHQLIQKVEHGGDHCYCNPFIVNASQLISFLIIYILNNTVKNKS